MEETEIEIKPATGFSLDLKEIWKRKELLYFFAWRDIKVKYKQTYLGILWSILQPALLVSLIYLVIYRTIKVEVGNMPYLLYVLSGIIMWGLFSSILLNSSESMIANAPIIRKIYFPRLIIPISASLVALVDYIFAFLLFVVLLLFLRQPLHWSAIVCFPLAVLMTLVSALGIGSMFAALNVKFRDFRYLLPFVAQLLFFSSQIIYSFHALPSNGLKNLLYVFPLNGALEIFRYPLDPSSFYAVGVYISVASMIFFLVLGITIFKKIEAYFADLV